MTESAHSRARAEFRPAAADLDTPHPTYAGQIVRGGLLGGLLALALAFVWWLAKTLVKREVEAVADELDDLLDPFLPTS
jgi:hypothetical protein